MIIGIVASQQKNVASATVWTYIGTSGAYDESWATTNSTTYTCKTFSTVLSSLNSSKPVGNYPVGYIIRVTHTRPCNSAVEPCQVDSRGRPLPVNCTAYYYKAE